MKTLKIGIMSKASFRQRSIDIATGKYKPKATEPKVWFSSIKSLAEVLNEKNLSLLKLIDQEKPESIKVLSEITGRQCSNLSRTLKKLEHYNIVELRKNEDNKSIRPIAKGVDFNIQYSA